MRVVVQRVLRAKVEVENKIVGKIDNGFLLLVGFKEDDDESKLGKMAKKIARLRIFDDEEGKMNLSLKDLHGQILSVSQFTLYGDAEKGNRPSFSQAMKGDKAISFYQKFNECLRQEDLSVEIGQFGAHMLVELQNDGPVTIILEN